MKPYFYLLLSCLVVSSLSCSQAERPTKTAGRILKVTTTTGMVGDLVKNIGGDDVVVESLMGPGVDPHLYKAKASDSSKLQQSDVVFYNGMMLEGKMQSVLERMAKSKTIIPVTSGIPENTLLKPEQFEGHFDPHVWCDVQLWAQCTDKIVEGLSKVDPTRAAAFKQRGADHKKQLMQLHEWALKKANELPPEKRILVTSHDAYNYFGRAYGFQVVGLQGISTVSEAGLADMTKLVDFIKNKKIKAIFVESSVPPGAIQRISQDSGVKIGGELFSDAMGTPGQIENGYDLGTYDGMVRHNLTTIVEALK